MITNQEKINLINARIASIDSNLNNLKSSDPSLGMEQEEIDILINQFEQSKKALENMIGILTQLV